VPRKPPGRCSAPGCPLPAGARGRCRTHALEADRQLKRRQPYRDYGAAWQRRRRQVLREEPLCRVCGAPAVDVDHVRPLRLGGGHELSNLQPLCRRHHAQKTARGL